MRVFIPSLLLIAAKPFPALADSLIDQARSASTDGPLYSYEMTLAYDDVDLAAFVDPSADEGERITVTSPTKENWPKDLEDDLVRMEANTDGDIWCKEFADVIPEDAVKTDETDTTATYAFTPLPEEDADNMERKVLKKVDAKITLAKDDGAVLAYKANLPKPYKPAMIAKVNTLNIDVSCERAPDGRTYVQSFDFALSGSAMMTDFDEKTTRKITKLVEPVS
ncbi:MAG: hypothetical protein AAF296_12175 [Pseudomonadota bacterium]